MDDNMHSGKKITKEDTWRPADLKEYIRVKENTDDYVRREDVNERRHRGSESRERQRRVPEEESRRERDKRREHRSTRENRAEDKYIDHRKGSLSDRRDGGRHVSDDRDKESRRERHVDVDKYSDDYREISNRRREKEEKHDRERNKERQKELEKHRVRERERYNDADVDKRREERERERRREQRDQEHRTERGHKESEEVEGKKKDKYDREQRDNQQDRNRHKVEHEDKRNEKERREKHGDRKHSERMHDREHKEEHRTRRDERERRHKERGHNEVERDMIEHRESKRSVQEVRHQRGDREKSERDKHRERRHREEEEPKQQHRERRHREEEEPKQQHRERRHREEEDEPGRSHRGRTSSKTSSSNDNHMHETIAQPSTVQTEELNEDLGEQDYEDDFEDYDEDFEELDESENEDVDEKEAVYFQVGQREELTPQKRKEIEAIQRAIEEENERVGTAQSRQSISREEEDRPNGSKASEKDQRKDSQRGKFIDFVAAKQREVSKKVATKQKKRSKELLHLIDLDFSMTFSLLDLPPVNEYDMYIRNFGSANTKQAYVQCNEDNADRDIQTEDIEICEKWTQHPPEHSGACGDPNLSQEDRDKLKSELTFDSRRLTAFLSSAAQVMVVLLEEDQVERNSLTRLGNQSEMLSFSKGGLQLNTELPFLSGRTISLLHFSPVQRHTMMTVHAPATTHGSEHLHSSTIICIWNIWEPSRPQKILVYESEIQCCCFSTGKAILVCAGTSVGSVVLWDLREPATNHYQKKIGENEWAFRQPAFSTDAVMLDSGHRSAVTSVEMVSSTAAGELRPELPLLAPEEELSGLSFQLASLDESGVLNFWVVVELPKANEAGSPTDLGLRPGSKVKLLHSSSLSTADRVSPRSAVKTGQLQTGQLKFLPSDSTHFFIGTNMGLVSHGTSHGLKAPPKFYRFQEPGVRPVVVTSIHFSPFRQNMFLVGCADGSIRLHEVSHEQPVAEWKNSKAEEPIVSLQWTQTRPTVFCVLDSASTLYVWDLLKNETAPVVTERINVDRVTAMAVFGDSGQQKLYSGVALAHQSGKIQIQYFIKDLNVPMTGEEEKLDSMVTEAF